MLGLKDLWKYWPQNKLGYVVAIIVIVCILVATLIIYHKNLASVSKTLFKLVGLKTVVTPQLIGQKKIKSFAADQPNSSNNTPQLTSVVISDNNNLLNADTTLPTVSGPNDLLINNPADNKAVTWQTGSINSGTNVYLREVYSDGTIKNYLAGNVQNGDVIKIGGLDVETKVVRQISKYTLMNAADSSEFDFKADKVDLSNLKEGENDFVLVKYYPDGSREFSNTIKLFYDKPVPNCTQTIKEIQGLAQVFESCDGRPEQPKGDKYCVNGNVDTANCDPANNNTPTTDQIPSTSNDQDNTKEQPKAVTQPPAPEAPKQEAPGTQETSTDNGDGTYIVFRSGNPYAEYRFSDYKEVVGKCRDTATNLNTLVIVKGGVEKVDVDCRQLGQTCQEFVNDSGQADAHCQ